MQNLAGVASKLAVGVWLGIFAAHMLWSWSKSKEEKQKAFTKRKEQRESKRVRPLNSITY